MITITPIKEVDILDLKNIISQSYENKEDVDYILNLIKNTLSKKPWDETEFYIVAKNEAGNILGLLGYRDLIPKFKQFSKGSKPIEIYQLFVSREFYRKGIGRCLVDFLIKYSIENHYDEVLVRSAYKFKGTGWDFYEKLGFQLVGKIESDNKEFSNIYRMSLHTHYTQR